MESTSNTIKCPNCGHDIDINNVLIKRFEEEFSQKLAAQKVEQEVKLNAELSSIEEQKEALKKQMVDQNKTVEELVNAEVSVQKKSLEVELKNKIKEEQSESMRVLQEELNEKSEQVKDLNKLKAEKAILEREKNELQTKIEAETAIELTKKIQEEKDKLKETLKSESDRIRKEEVDRQEFKILELNTKLEAQVKLTEEMRRKQEQGSMQLQGEVQELAIEEWLRIQFPLDTVDEVKKGALGADCVQTVHTRTHQNCGKICYESKRTKGFNEEWIIKLKKDTLSAGAVIGVLVTQVYPRNVERMSLVDGVWVCTFEEFKGLCAVLREGLIQVSMSIIAQENKGDKMVMLYSYLTGNDFRAQVEAIVSGFTFLQEGLQSEKKAMTRIWAERQKQIDRVIENTISMYGSVKGIAGAAVPEIKQLQLGENG